MTPERWKRIRSAIEAALEHPIDRRDAVLVEACAGDAALLSEARAIFGAAHGSADFLGAPPTLTHDEAGDTQPERPSLLGRTLSHYRLEERIGSGGMGEVYRARDLALGRESAIKVLPRRVRPELRQRLLREAKAAARLQHPAIATFLEAGEERDEAFIAMEFVRGETLRERLRRGPLPFDEWLALASCLLGALGHAHAAGLLHRDIKPENIMLTGPRSAKLLDFGLARRLATAVAESDVALTAEGVVPGTAGYMSPEQIVGGALDARSDLFQAGVVLYECLTVESPFGGGSPAERLAAVLLREADLAGLGGARLPAGLAPILARALARDRERRYPTAMAFLRDLMSLQEGRVDTALPRILAVVDFENLAGDAALDWLGAGIAESLAAELASVDALTVLPRPRVVKALEARAAGGHPRDSASPDLELGLALGCGFVVSGAYQQASGALRITSRLTAVATGQVLATEKLDGKLDQIFELQDRLAAAVLGRLELHASLAARAQQPKAMRVYELVTRGRALSLKLDREGDDQAIQLLEEALRLDDDDAAAHAELAQVYGHRAIVTSRREDVESALAHAERAIALHPRNVDAHRHKGYALSRLGRSDAAVPVLLRAIELDPNDAHAHYLAGGITMFQGNPQQGLGHLQRAVELEPRMGFGWLILGATHLKLGNLAAARFAFTRCLELELQPQTIFPSAGAAGYLAEVLRMEGRLEQARRRALEGVAAAEASDNAYRDVFRGYALCVLGRVALQQGDRDAARAAFGQVLAQLRARTRPRACGHLMVQALAGLGRAGDAAAFDEGLQLFETRHTWNFEEFAGCQSEQDLLELARAAHGLGRAAQAETLLARAREAGSLEALEPASTDAVPHT